MTGKIYEIKNRLVDQLEKDMREKGPERIDPEMVDMVKDLAEAEKACMEAEYYSNVIEAMGGASGYAPMGYMPQGYQARGDRSGWQNQYGSGYSGRAYPSRRGYDDGPMGYQDAVEGIRSAMQGAGAEERERMRGELRSLLGGAM